MRSRKAVDAVHRIPGDFGDSDSEEYLNRSDVQESDAEKPADGGTSVYYLFIYISYSMQP